MELYAISFVSFFLNKENIVISAKVFFYEESRVPLCDIDTPRHAIIK